MKHATSYYQGPGYHQQRRSAWVTISIAAALVVGAPVLFYACSEEKDPVEEGVAYNNNHYVPGAGYYHSGYHSFFPFRHNHFDASRGEYFYGGSWNAKPDTRTNLSASIPSRASAEKANRLFRSAHPSSRGGFGKTGSFFSSSS